MKKLLIGLLALGSISSYAAPVLIEHSTCNIRSQATNLSDKDIKGLEELGFNYIESESNSRVDIDLLEGNELNEGILVVTGAPSFSKRVDGKVCLFGAQLHFSSDVRVYSLRESGDSAIAVSSQKLADLGGYRGGKCYSKKKRSEIAKNKIAFTWWGLPKCVIK